jgi:hypothetical protein
MKMNMKRKKSATRAYFGDNKACENESVQQSVQKNGITSSDVDTGEQHRQSTQRLRNRSREKSTA